MLFPSPLKCDDRSYCRSSLEVIRLQSDWKTVMGNWNNWLIILWLPHFDLQCICFSRFMKHKQIWARLQFLICKYFREKVQNIYLGFVKCSKQLLEPNFCPPLSPFSPKMFKYGFETLKIEGGHIPIFF